MFNPACAAELAKLAQKAKIAFQKKNLAVAVGNDGR
jgi:hypothetical protein